MRSSWSVKEPSRIFKFLITLIIILAVPIVGVYAWYNWALEPVGSDKEKNFIIKNGESTPSFAKRLEEAEIVKSAFAFRLHLKISGIDKKIQAGSFRIAGNISAEKVAEALTKGRQDAWVTIFEGIRKEQTAEILAKTFDIDEDKFISMAREGYLFPDTYLIPLKDKETEILAIFEKNFNNRFSADLVAQANAKGLSQAEVINLASIVERETRKADERPIIAGILLNRLNDGGSLGVDATIQYALGYSEEEKGWWRKIITEEDLKINSPYNSRVRAGLPPGPICSPGLAAIKSVINPTETDYYFYIHDKEGKAHYARNFQEHQDNIAKYLR